MKLFRVRKCDERIDLVEKTSYNPDVVLGRCNLEGKEKASLYLSNFIIPGIFETIIRSKENYFNKHNSEFAGKKFIIGEWNFNANELHNVNFHYSHPLPDGYKSPFIDEINKKFDNSIKDRPIEEHELIRSIVLEVKKIFYSKRYELSAALCDWIIFPRIEKNKSVDFICYPTSIPELIGTNIAIPKRIVDDKSRVYPIKYNYCELKKREEQVETDLGSGISWHILEVGEPEPNGNKIEWRTYEGTDDKLLIKDRRTEYK